MLRRRWVTLFSLSIYIILEISEKIKLLFVG